MADLVPVVQIGLVFVDRDMNDATLTMYADSSIPVDDVFDFAINKIDHLYQLSSALIARIELTWRWIEDGAGTGRKGSIQPNLMLFTQNGAGEIGTIKVPQPKASIFEQTGPYAGIRVDMQNTAIINFADMLVQRPLKTQDGRDLGQLLTGGLVY